jgi:hypothetical protein
MKIKVKIHVFLSNLNTFQHKKVKNMSIVVALDPVPVPNVRISIRFQTSGSGSAKLVVTQDLQVSNAHYKYICRTTNESKKLLYTAPTSARMILQGLSLIPRIRAEQTFQIHGIRSEKACFFSLLQWNPYILQRFKF